MKVSLALTTLLLLTIVNQAMACGDKSEDDTHDAGTCRYGQYQDLKLVAKLLNLN